MLLLRCGQVGLRARQLGRDIPPLPPEFVQQQVRMPPIMISSISSGAGRCCLGASGGQILGQPFRLPAVRGALAFDLTQLANYLGPVQAFLSQISGQPVAFGA
jgi:hypothetical protein